MKRKLTVLLLTLVMILAFVPMTALAATDENNGDWGEKYVALKNTAEAELMVRVGDIDNVGYGFRDNYNRFTAATTSSHRYPWKADPADPDGTDRIMLGSSANKTGGKDGYSRAFNKDDPDATKPRPIVMKYGTSGIAIKSALLQLYIDDFQATVWKSNFKATINGKDAPFIAEVINHMNQTGPVASIISIEIPGSFLKDIASGSLSILIDDPTTGVGDGYAIDFVKLLVNYKRSSYIGTITGTVVDGSGNPLEGATVRVLGTKNTVKTGANGNFTAEVIAGMNVVRGSKDGFIENYQFGIVQSGNTLDLEKSKGKLKLSKGAGTPDIDYYSFAEGKAWSDASKWATEELNKADELGLIPEILKGADMTKPITREEFATLVVRLYEKVTGKTAAAASTNPFTDTQNPEILKAYQLSITQGTSATTFTPWELTNREQVATMLSRAIRVMVPNGDFSVAGAPAFSDQGDISSWAVEHVKFMGKMGIIKGADGKFMPRATTTTQQAAGYATTTREQAIAMGVRIFEQYKTAGSNQGTQTNSSVSQVNSSISNDVIKQNIERLDSYRRIINTVTTDSKTGKQYISKKEFAYIKAPVSTYTKLEFPTSDSYSEEIIIGEKSWTRMSPTEKWTAWESFMSEQPVRLKYDVSTQAYPIDYGKLTYVKSGSEKVNGINCIKYTVSGSYNDAVSFDTSKKTYPIMLAVTGSIWIADDTAIGQAIIRQRITVNGDLTVGTDSSSHVVAKDVIEDDVMDINSVVIQPPKN